jgi:DinB superfamily
MQKTVDEFKTLVEQSSLRLAAISESDSKEKSSPEKWSKKETLGHLIDSAANNHQRFVRAQLTSKLRIPGYEQQVWVTTQRYQSESWANLFQLWKSYNFHLLHIISAIPENALGSICVIGDNKPVTLEFVIQDYVRHLKHHLEQILE